MTRTLARGLITAALALLPLTSQAEETRQAEAPGEPEAPASTARFGVALNTSVNGELYPMRLVPSATVLLGKHQLEAGVGFHPFIRKDQRIISGELNYKLYPNGLDDKLNAYLIGRLSYVHNKRETFYPTTYNYLFLKAGYGLTLNAAGGSYLGTNVSVGGFTFNRRSENPYFDSDAFFDEVGWTLALQFNVGYRF